MIKQTITGILGLVFLGFSYSTAFADQSLDQEKQAVDALSQRIAEIISDESSQDLDQIPSAEPQTTAGKLPPAVALPQPDLYYVAVQKAKQPPTVLSLDLINNNSQSKPKLQIELNSSVIIEGQGIQRFLLVDEGFVGVKVLDADHLKIDTIRIGTTFLHVWDNAGRHSFFVEVIFPKSVMANLFPVSNGVWHSQPFTATYSNDWSTYYSGKNISALERQSYDLDQSLGLTGETPYGFLDTSGTYTDFNGFSQIETYTLGLSQIPLEGTSNFNLRAFDALRYQSELTMPGTRLRGAFADVDLMDDMVGLSLSHGQEQVPLGFIDTGGTQFNNSYIDAFKLTLFPKSEIDRYSFNFATSYGADRPRYLTDHVYSVEGQHKFNDKLTLNAEAGSDSTHDSSRASLNWQDGGFKTGLHFRDIDRDYSTISTLPANQGELGAAWVANADFSKVSASSFVEAYRDRLNFNPDRPTAFNYDANEHLRANITHDLWSDSDFNYVDMPGEISPYRSLGLNERLSQGFGIWRSLRATVFAGAGYQNSHSSNSNISDYDREDVIAGIQLPLTNQISSFANYEYDWFDQPDSGGRSNPNVINAGLGYQKQINDKFSVNSQAVYRDELGVNRDSSFLSGQRSLIISSGFAYNPTPDVSVFADCDASKVLFHTNNPSYDDFEVHVGMRITLGSAMYWDPVGIVSGIVFKDRMGNGKFALGDEGIAGVKVRVGDRQAVTDKNGHYRIKVRAKFVDVTPVLDTVPGGLMFSTPQSLNVRVIQGRKSEADFGLMSQTGVYGIVFVDRDNSGIPNANDQFVGKVKVILDGKIVQKSDPYGAYYFRKVSPGEHVISIDINTLALNMVPMVKLTNKINVAEGTNYAFNIPVQIKQEQGDQN